MESVGPIHMWGAQKDKLYYTLAPLYREGKIYTPVDTNVFMRPVLTREEAEELVRNIPDIQAVVCTERNPRILGEFYQGLIRSHNCVNMIQVIKTAHRKCEDRRARGIKPGQVDERYLKRAEDLLYGELAVSLEIPKEDVVGYISQVVEGVG